MNLLVTIVVVITTSYTLASFANSRRSRKLPGVATQDLFFVFLAPASTRRW